MQSVSLHQRRHSARRTLCGFAVAVAATTGCGDRSESDGETPPRLHAVVPSIAIVGESVDLVVSPLTDIGTPDAEWSGRLEIEATDRAFHSPAPFRPTGRGAFVMEGASFGTPGVHRITVRSDSGDIAVAGPTRVVRSAEELRPREGETALRVWWGDAHGHSDVGDGAHPPAQYFYYAREVARLDFTCLSEHDYQQFLEVGLDEVEGSWGDLAATAREWRRPGFAVLLGWEWSSRFHGHRVVFFPNDRSRYASFQDASSPADLAAALEGTGAFSVIAHPSGSELTPTIDWDTVEPGFDRAIEIYSGHGTMDGDTTFRPTSEPRPGTSAVDAIRRGHRLAFVGFSDTHLSTPGNPWPPPMRDAPYRGGLTAVYAPAATESDVFEALRDGRCYATSGERFLIDLRVAGRGMGETVQMAAEATVVVEAFAAAAEPWRRLEIMRGTEVVAEFGAGEPTVEFSREIGPLEGDTAVWLRGESVSGERFWTTPIWILAG